jgi:hypothetical protein
VANKLRGGRVEPNDSIHEDPDHEPITAYDARDVWHLLAGLRRIAEHDWNEPPGEMPDEMARAALAAFGDQQ